MTLKDVLGINLKFLRFEDWRKLEYCDARWMQHGQPLKKWEMVNFLEKMIRELQAQGGYPKVLLFRKKEIQRADFILPEPEQMAGRSAGVACADCHGSGWLGSEKTGRWPCPCAAGDGPRQELRRLGLLKTVA